MLIWPRIPAGRWGTRRSRVTELPVLLASGSADYIHGTVLTIDAGGWLVDRPGRHSPELSLGEPSPWSTPNTMACGSSRSLARSMHPAPGLDPTRWACRLGGGAPRPRAALRPAGTGSDHLLRLRTLKRSCTVGHCATVPYGRDRTEAASQPAPSSPTYERVTVTRAPRAGIMGRMQALHDFRRAVPRLSTATLIARLSSSCWRLLWSSYPVVSRPVDNFVGQLIDRIRGPAAAIVDASTCIGSGS